MQGDASSGGSGRHGARSLVVVVPRAASDVCRSLRHALGDDAKVQVVLDRRLTDRRVRADAYGSERRRGERRRRSDADAELGLGRWIAVPGVARHRGVLDADGRAVLFLCCADHVVPCQTCQDTYRLRWLARVTPDAFACARCGADLTPIVVAHVQACRASAGRGTGATPPPATAEQHDAPAAAASG